MKKQKVNSSTITLPKLISDGMVLQRDCDFKIWGWGLPGEEIELIFCEGIYNTVVNSKGQWEIIIPPQNAGGPHKMLIKSKRDTLAIDDILIGDVWLCSGQSNMELPVQRVKDKYEKEINNSENPMIREFKVEMEYNFNNSQKDVKKGKWQSADPQNVLEFSAAAYFFAEKLYKKYRIPVGIVNASKGGTPVESWMSREALQLFPEKLKEVDKYKDKKYVKNIVQNRLKEVEKWYRELEEKDKGKNESNKWYERGIDTSDWKTIKIPASFDKEGLKDFKGVIYFKKEIEISENLLDKPAELWMGTIVDSDTAYINGKKVGSTDYRYPPRKYKIPENVLEKGKNIIVLRVICNNGEGEFINDKPYELKLGDKNIDLKGEWKYKVGAEMNQERPEEVFMEWNPLGLYNGMINPLINYKIKGFAWYQGESNTDNPYNYHKLFSTLINDWREKWGQGELPFLYVQLPNFGVPEYYSNKSSWAVLREMQRKTLEVPNTEMVVAIDIGEWNDLHPLNKKDIGKRLALAAQYIAYDEDLVPTGPIYKKAELKGSKVFISFKYIDSGLIINDGQKLNGFVIASENGEFVPAEAEIKDDKVIVWNENIKEPYRVRYAWADNPENANLYNGKGLPASPFETVISVDAE